MAIFVGLDVHRAQITYDVLDPGRGGEDRPDPPGEPCDRAR
jgi:hypothetical protein